MNFVCQLDQSLNTGKCPNTGRCHHGYHVKGSKVESQNVRNENVRDVRNDFSSSSSAPVGGEVRSFLEVLVRKELQSLFSPMQRQPNQFTVMDWLTRSAV